MADDQYLTPAQVAEELHVTVVTVRRWIANGELRASKAGPRKWMIRRSDLAEFLSGAAPAGGGDVGVEAVGGSVVPAVSGGAR